MIKVGVNGVSLGDLNAGVMAGANMLSFVPLHLSAVDCLEGLLPCWLLSWTEIPLSRLLPWRFRNTTTLVQDVDDRVSGMWESDFSHVGCCLRKLLSTARSLS